MTKSLFLEKWEKFWHKHLNETFKEDLNALLRRERAEGVLLAVKTWERRVGTPWAGSKPLIELAFSIIEAGGK